MVVEIRSLEDLGSASTLIASIPALVLRDGRVVNAYGTPIVIPSRSTNYEYHIAIRHRNHLGVMSTNAYAFGGLTADTTITVNFTTPGVAYGTNPQKVLNGVALMRA